MPKEIWDKVFEAFDKAFFPTGHPNVHMEGQCKCGKLQFRVDGTLAASFFCHCHMCRKYWSQATPTETLWIQPSTAVTVTAGQEHYASWTVEKLTRNLRGQATCHFCRNCGTNLNVTFSDPNASFTLMWPNNFKYDEWGDLSGKGANAGTKARHGYAKMFCPRFHAHYENRSVDVEDSLPKLADIFLEGQPLMNNAGDVVGKVTFPMPGFERGWDLAPTVGMEPAPNAPRVSKL
jgi:hypothetical protein